MICGAAFCIGATVTLLFLVADSGERRRWPRARSYRLDWLARRLPESASLDAMAYRIHAFMFPLWTFAIVAGAIWAENAWGRYWGWDPKETWAFITWGRLRRLPARPRDRRLEGSQGRGHRARGLRVLRVQLRRRQHPHHRAALLRRSQLTQGLDGAVVGAGHVVITWGGVPPQHDVVSNPNPNPHPSSAARPQPRWRSHAGR